MNAIYRLLPLLMFVCLCLMLWQYVSGAKDGILDFLAAIRWYLLAAFFLMLALLRAVWLHAHDRAPDWIYRIIPMDILDRLSNRAYNAEEQPIKILTKNGRVIDVARASDQSNLEALAKPVVKYYVCYPKRKHP